MIEVFVLGFILLTVIGCCQAAWDESTKRKNAPTANPVPVDPLEKMRRRVRELQWDLEIVNEEKSEMEQKFLEADQGKRTLLNAYSRKCTEVITHQRAVTNKEAQRRRFQNLYSQKCSQVETHGHNAKIYEKNIKTLQEQYDRKCSEVKTLEQNAKNNEHARKQLKQQYTQLQAESQEQRKTNSNLAAENSQLNNQIEELKTQTEELHDELSNLQDAELIYDQVMCHGVADGGVTPLLQHALKTRQDRCAKILIEAGSEIHAQCGWQRTALHIAAQLNLKTICISLIQKGVMLNAADCRGQSPLHYAAQHDSIGAAKALVEAGAAIDIRDWQRCTPLHCACQHGSYQVAKLLVEYGSDETLINEEGEDPFDCFLASEDLSEESKRPLKERMRALFPHVHSFPFQN